MQLQRDVKYAKHVTIREANADEEPLDMAVLAVKLSNMGYRVHLRAALGGGTGTACFHNLRHEFLVVSGDGPAEGIDFIVEPNFREHFEIPQITDRYAGLLEAIPSELVATEDQLTALVNLLCSEMSLAFERCGLSLPPWRQSKSLLSK